VTASPDVDRAEVALRRWLDTHGVASWDPYDGLNAAPPWAWLRRNRFAARALMQAVKHSPVNLRPVLGVPKRIMAKSLADLASAAWLRYRLGDDPAARVTARHWLDALLEDRCAGHSGAAWGMPAPYVSRFIDAASGEPNLFWTINAANAFLEAYELEGRAADLEVARSAIDFIRQDLGFVDAGEAGVWLRYFADHDAVIYNVTALGGALLQRVAHHTGEAELAALGERALHFVIRNQNPDGPHAWAPATGPLDDSA